MTDWIKAIEERVEKAGDWDSLDNTPMMPASKADPAYGGAAHRFILHSRQDIPRLLAVVRAAERLMPFIWETGMESKVETEFEKAVVELRSALKGGQ